LLTRKGVLPVSAAQNPQAIETFPPFCVEIWQLFTLFCVEMWKLFPPFCVEIWKVFLYSVSKCGSYHKILNADSQNLGPCNEPPVPSYYYYYCCFGHEVRPVNDLFRPRVLPIVGAAVSYAPLTEISLCSLRRMVTWKYSFTRF
jgi:hypothetical protein